MEALNLLFSHHPIIIAFKACTKRSGKNNLANEAESVSCTLAFFSILVFLPGYSPTAHGRRSEEDCKTQRSEHRQRNWPSGIENLDIEIEHIQLLTMNQKLN